MLRLSANLKTVNYIYLLLILGMLLGACQQVSGDLSREELEQLTQDIAAQARNDMLSLDPLARQRLKLVNGGFEEDLSGWQRCTTRFSLPASVSNANHVYSGTKAGQTGPELYYRCAYQNVSLPTELDVSQLQKLVFNCFVKFPQDFDFNYGYANYLSITLNNTSGTTWTDSKLEFSQGTTGEYKRQRVILSDIPQDASFAQVTIFGRDSFFVDECKLVAVTDDNAEIDLGE
ncbi:MAG: hypothetical protein R2880_09250 [Deinococcales bacterium]